MSVTPGRKTVVTIDAPTHSTVEPRYYLEVEDEMISAGGPDFADHVELIPTIGWRLASYQRVASEKHEKSVADASAITPSNGNATVATGLLEVSVQRANTELTGVALGSQRAAGDKHLQKNVAAGATFAAELADGAAFTKPDSANDTVPLDRVLVSKEIHEPYQTITVTLYPMPANGLKTVQRIIRIYFSGIPGSTATDTAAKKGVGAYSLALSGDGTAELYERLKDNTWRFRKLFQWAAPSDVAGKAHTITIASDATKEGGKWVGSKIMFEFGSVGNALEAAVRGITSFATGPRWQYYHVPQFDKSIAPTLQPIRADVRRDVRAIFQFHVARYFPSGTLKSGNFGLAHPPTGDEPIRLEYYGDIPEGTSVDCALYDADGTALVLDDSPTVATLTSGARSFLPVTRHRFFYAVFTLHASADGKKTPTVHRMRVIRHATLKAYTPEPVVPIRVTGLSFTGAGPDPMTESGLIAIEDLEGSLTSLRTRGKQPVRVEVRYDPADPTKVSRLFQGYAVTTRGKRKGSARTEDVGGSFMRPRQFPSANWREFTVRCAGEWAKLARMQAPALIAFNNDPALAKPTPYKVTDVVRRLLWDAGYPEEMVDVPDMPIRFFSDGKTSLLVEQYTELGPLIVQLVRDYLGGYLIFDQNVGDFGAWRVKLAPRPPYRNLAEFVTDRTWTAPGLRQGMNLNAYDPTTDAGGQVVKRVPIRKGTLVEEPVPPECNILYVTGVGSPGGSLSKSGSDNSVALSQWTYNPKSAWLFDDQPVPPDPESPDYLGYALPLYYSDGGLNTPHAVNFTLRRIYDMAAHGQLRKTFEAPLVLVQDQSDPLAARLRPLMFGDGILFNGEQYIVDSCNADYSGRSGGDRIQAAAYEIFQVPALQDYSLPTLGRTD
jgi:hypothetical protein